MWFENNSLTILVHPLRFSSEIQTAFTHEVAKLPRKRPSKQFFGLFESSASHEAPYSRRSYRRAIDFEKLMTDDVHAFGTSPRREGLERSCRSCAKAEIAADVYRRGKRVPKHRMQKLLGRLCSELARERYDDDMICASTGEHLDALAIRHDLLESVGAEQLVGVMVERDDDARALPLERFSSRAVDYEAMALMNTVEHPECARSSSEHVGTAWIVSRHYAGYAIMCLSFIHG